MHLEILRGELERHFELDELESLSRDLLGFDPDEVGGTATKGSFASALAEHCVKHDAVEALCDVLLAVRPNVDARIHELQLQGTLGERTLRAGDQLGPFRIARLLGEGRAGAVYLARDGSTGVRLKLLRARAVRDKRNLHRYLAHSRLVSRVDHIGLPQNLRADRSGDTHYVAHDMVEGQTLASRMAWAGPLHFNEVRPLLVAMLEALQALHRKSLYHGNLHAENVVVARSDTGDTYAVLLDAGAERLRASKRATNGGGALMAPEQIVDEISDARTDVYAFGALMYQLLSGHPVFPGTPLQAAVNQLNGEPPELGRVAPLGWVASEVERLTHDTLAKDPAGRPRDATQLLELFEKLGRSATRTERHEVDAERLDRSIENLLQEPESEGLARDLEQLVDLGADVTRVAEAFNMAADVLEGPDVPPSAKVSLLLRAARLYESRPETLAAAEKAYESALKLVPDDELSLAGLEDVRKRAGKYEELVEMLLERNEKTKDSSQRAANFLEIGRAYSEHLGDTEQALIAYTQAFLEEPMIASHAIELERVAAGDERAWQDVLSSLSDAVQDGAATTATRSRIYLKMAEWYQSHLARFDLATSCLNHVLETDPANDEALANLAEIYRRSQQWRELGITLARRAEAAPPPLARDLNTEAAEILEHQLNDSGGARDLYERVFRKDPSHHRAAEGLSRIYERAGDFKGLAKILRRRSDALRGEDRARALCRLAEILALHLNESDEAIFVYESVLAEHEKHSEALRGLDKVLESLGRHQELLGVLEREVELAATPRQKIELTTRIADIHENEFLDHGRAAAARESILEWDRANLDTIIALMRNYRALERWEPLSSLYEKRLGLDTDPRHRVELSLEWGRLLSDQIQSAERAARAYELVLEVEAKHEAALDALARLKESTGDTEAAVEAILALADKAKSPYERSQQLLRAANVLKTGGNLDRAIENLKQAVDADPDNPMVRTALRDAYIDRGDIVAALKLFERELQIVEGERAKAKLCSRMARLARERLEDNQRAEEAAKRALEFDPTDLDGLSILGDLAFENHRFVEAGRHYETVVGRADNLPIEEAKRILLRYVESLARAEKWAKAERPIAKLEALAGEDAQAMESIAHLTLRYGDARAAERRYHDLLRHFENKLPLELRAPVELRYGEALRKVGESGAALGHLKRAAELDPRLDAALAAQAAIHAELGDWNEVLQLKHQLLQTSGEKARFQLLVDIGDVALEHLGDRAEAADHYIKALEEKPDDRRTLTKLMQLYSEQEEWNKLVDVVLKLANFVEESAQKSKYLETAAVVTAHQIGDAKQALEYYERAFSLSPSIKALDEAIEIYKTRGAHAEVERLLRQRLHVATELDDKAAMLLTFTELGELYEKELGDVENAIDAYEAAQMLEPSNERRADLLSELYATDHQRFLDRAVKLHASLLEHDARREKSYRALRRFYTEARDADASWCLCQTMSVLRLADEDERRYYLRLRPGTAAAVQTALSDEDWLGHVLHPLADPLLTSVFALIEPAVIESRAEPLEEFGYGEEHRIELDRHYATLSRSLHHAAGALGVPLPPTYENTNDPGGLSFLHTFDPSIVLGKAALNAEIPNQAAAFIASRHLTYLRPGLYLRQLVGTGTGLKSWLFAAIKLTAPQFPIAAEMEGPIREALDALKSSLSATARDHLTRVVTKMLQTGAALDLKRWIAGVDLTADRAGFIMANDLDIAAEILEVSDDSASAVASDERYRELAVYSVSPSYFALRRKLGLAISE